MTSSSMSGSDRKPCLCSLEIHCLNHKRSVIFTCLSVSTRAKYDGFSMFMTGLYTSVVIFFFWSLCTPFALGAPGKVVK